METMEVENTIESDQQLLNDSSGKLIEMTEDKSELKEDPII